LSIALSFPEKLEINHNQDQFNITHYLINIEIDPKGRSLSGFSEISIISEKDGLNEIILDLHENYQVSSITSNGKDLQFVREKDIIIINLALEQEKDQRSRIKVEYSGKPPKAGNPPWDAGFVWSKDNDGFPWIGVTCQGRGPYVWFPSKNKLNDEPDSVDIVVTVPEPLFCASNGLLIDEINVGNNKTKYHWKTRYPVNNYCISINVGHYETVRRLYKDKMELVYYVLPQERDGAEALLDEAAEMLEFYERNFGQYPFNKEKFGLVQTKYWGMEHQTINAYGNHYKKTRLGYDFLMLHEMSHEWWGNLLTVDDWKDAWIHEGIGTYAEGLYIEEKYGMDEYFKFFKNRVRKNLRNKVAVIPETAPENGQFDSDIYYKGAHIMHTLRYLVGKETLMQILNESLHRPKMKKYNHINSIEWFELANEMSNNDYSWFFNAYFYNKEIPTLREKSVKTKTGKTLEATWETEGFAMPLEIIWKENKTVIKREKINLSNVPSTIVIPKGQKIEWDPDGWVLFNISK